MSGIEIAALAAGALAAGGNAYAQGKVNKKTREWNEKMFHMQNTQNEKYWHMQNDYNSPLAQMQRMQETGLNPALMYGHGAGNNSAANIDSAKPQTWSPSAPQFSAESALAPYMNMKAQKANIDNLRAQNNLIVADTINKQMQTTKGLQDNQFGRELHKYNLQALQANVAKTQMETTEVHSRSQLQEANRFQIEDNMAYKKILHDYEVKGKKVGLLEAAERILRSQQSRTRDQAEIRRIDEQIKNLKKDGQMKQMDNYFKAQGIQPGDNYFLRLLQFSIQGTGNTDDFSIQDF